MTATPDHKARGHSELGASICSRWWNCPGSVALSRGIPNRETEHARRGTAAHELAQLCLEQNTDASAGLGLVLHGIEVDQTMADAVQVYLDDCRSVDGEAMIEVQFDMSPLRPPVPMFGTADFVAYDQATKTLYVKDYKNGFLHVDAGSPQLRYYAIGAVLALGPGKPVHHVEVTIVQPNGRDSAVRRTTYTVGDLATWSSELMDRARATQRPDAPLQAGDWCRFCPAAGVCPAQAQSALEAAQIDFADVVSVQATALALAETRLITIEQVAAIKAHAPQIRAWLDAIDGVAEAELKAGRDVPGFKLVAGDTRRQWGGEEGVIARTLGDLGLDPIEKKLISPAKAEAALAEKLQGKTKKERAERAKAELADYVVKPEGAPKVVPAADPRPALLAAGAEFDALPANH